MGAALEWLLPPLSGGLIGWATNALAVRMLFRPRRPWRLLPGLTVQGLLPRRRAELAEALADAVATELVDPRALLDRALGAAARAEMAAALADGVVDAVRRRLPPLLPPAWQARILDYVAGVARAEAERLVAERLPALAGTLAAGADVRGLVRERLERLDLDQLERLVCRLAARELRWIEWMGGVLGVMVGAAQALLVQLVR